MRKIYFFLLILYASCFHFLLAQEPKTYQHLIMYGQSMSTGAQSYPVLSPENVAGNYMVGDQIWIKQGNTNFQEFKPLKGTIAISYQDQPQTRDALTFGETTLLGLTNHLQLKQPGANINYVASSDGENGKSIEVLSKQGVSGKQNYYSDYFQKSITSAYIAAKTNNENISSPAIFWLQGEYNYLNLYDDTTSGATSDKDSYKNLLISLKNDMQNDIMSTYGQSQKPVFITYQAGSIIKNSELMSIGNAQVEVSNTYDDIICSGPLYQMPHRGVHLDPNGYRWYGEMLAKVYYKTQVLKEDFKPLQPKKIFRIGSNQVGILFYVPVPPLAFDIQTLPKAQDYGFVIKNNGVKQTISNIIISGNQVTITCSAALSGTIDVIYGEGRITTSTSDTQGTTGNTTGNVNYKFGNLRDSDNYSSSYTYLDLDKKVGGNYIYPRDVSETTLHPYYEPKDQGGTVIYDRPYPLYNFSVSFGYTLNTGRTEIFMPGFFPKTDILYVKKGSTGDGSSWSSALGEVADALKIAEEQNSGNQINVKQIWVAKGTYIPKYIAGDGTNATNDRSFVLPRNVGIYGGFSGLEASVTQRDWKNNLTILSGDTSGNDGANFTNITDNTYHVVISAGDVGATILDGFTIKGGNASVAGNYSINLYGKKIFTGYGGGLYVSGSQPKLNNLIISNNHAVEAGAGLVVDVSSPVLTNITISDNKVDGTKSIGGGGVYNYQSASIWSKVTISNNKVESSNTGILGGGIYNLQSPNLKFSNIIISGNSTVLATQTATGYGGGIFNKQSPVTITNGLIINNKAQTGGGIFIENSDASKLINLTLTGNQATTGSGLYNHTMAAQLYNTVAWNNTPANSTVVTYNGTPVYYNSLVQNITNTTNNNIAGTTDPLFVNTAGGDYHLQPASPIINRGNNSFLQNAGLDVDGSPRIISGTIDLGAYEYQQEQNCSWGEISLTDTEITYDQNSHEVTASNLPANVTVTYTYKGVSPTTYPEQTQAPTNAGNYTVTATVTKNENPDCQIILTALLTIKKAPAIINSESIQVFNYDGNVKSVTASLNHIEAVLSYSPQQGYTNTGTYPITISAPETTNYLAATKTVSLVINKIYFTGITFPGGTYTYDGNPHGLAVSGTLPTGTTTTYQNNNQTNAGSYTVTATLKNPNYYDLVLTANLLINKADFTGITLPNGTYTYDGNPHSLTVSGTLPAGTTVTYLNNGQTNAGSYTVTATLKNPNYNDLVLTANLLINKADFTRITLPDGTYTYDGNPHSLAVSGTLPAGTTTTYQNNNQTNAGSYTITATIKNPNYNDLVLTATLTINKAQAVITASATQTFTYDGTVKNATASLNHTETTLSYSPQQGYINVGTYSITISAPETANYLAVTKTVSLVINKANFTGITLSNGTFNYDGTAHSLAISGTPPVGTTVTYQNNNQINAGSYTVTATLTNPNYNDLVLNATLLINKINFTGITLSNGMFNYDGITHSLAISGTPPAGTTVTYQNNGQINAGSYTVTATLTNPNYNDLVLNATLLINKINFTGITLSNGTFNYDGTAHSLAISGTPPVGTTVTYQNNNQINAGSYTVTATLTNPNYNDLVLNATLLINKINFTGITLSNGTFNYDGTAHSLAISGTPPAGTTVTYQNNNQINAGSYTVTATLTNPNYNDLVLNATLLINKINFTGITLPDGTYTYDGVSHSLAVNGSVPTGTTVNYQNNGKINAGSYTVTATLTNPNYYDLILTATLTINKAPAVITASATQTFTYDGTVKNTAASLNHTETTLSYSPQQGYTNPGTYSITISAPATANYLAVTKTVSLVINKASFTGITLPNGTYTYDSIVHSLVISGTPPAGTTVTYLNNGQTNAGSYTVTATLSKPNYNDLVLTATLTINKAPAVITASATQTFTYDGTVKNVTASLNHTETTLSYSPQQGYTNPGTYSITISAPATANYLAVTKTVSLVINKVSFTGITLSNGTYTYDGIVHSLVISGTPPAGTTVTYLNNGQTNAGSYTVTATLSKPNYTDLVLTATLTINKAISVITASDIQTFTYDGSLKNATASLNHTEAALSYSPQQGYTDIGTYTITISAPETANYLAAAKQIQLQIDSNLNVDNPDNIEVKRLRVAPNPVSTILKVFFPEPVSNKGIIKIYDLMGQLVWEDTVIPGTTVKEIDFRYFYSGTYLLKYNNSVIKIIRD